MYANDRRFKISSIEPQPKGMAYAHATPGKGLIAFFPYLCQEAIELRQQLFAGQIMQVRYLAALADFLNLCRQFVSERCSPYRPEHIHRQLAASDYSGWCADTQAAFRADVNIHQSFQQLLGASALNLGEPEYLYFDCLQLRIAAPVDSQPRTRMAQVGVHRDTWGVGIDQQINLWAPITSLARNRTMGFYPDYWNRPLANTTDSWSFSSYRKAMQLVSPGLAPEYPSAPEARLWPSSACLPVLPELGSMLLFSSAHLHRSIPNRSRLTRFSFETRIVNKLDIAAGRGAPNPDCRTHPPLYKLFRNITNGDKLE